MLKQKKTTKKQITKVKPIDSEVGIMFEDEKELAEDQNEDLTTDEAATEEIEDTEALEAEPDEETAEEVEVSEPKKGDEEEKPEAPEESEQGDLKEEKNLETLSISEPENDTDEAVESLEKNKTEEKPEEDTRDVLDLLPKFGDVPKPEAIKPQTPEEEAYFKEHGALPTKVEKTEAEVKLEKKEFDELEKNEEAEIDKGKESIGTLRTVAQVTATVAQKPVELVEIESILQEGLGDYYKTMTPSQQREFKKVGEETASTIWSMLKRAKVKIVKILKLILSWLKIIPGVNKHFLEQECKIKADKLMTWKKSKDGQL